MTLRRLAAATCALGLSFAAASHAAPPKVSYKDLPLVEAMDLPALDKRPTSLAAGTTVEGIKVVQTHTNLPASKKRPARVLPGQVQVEVLGDTADVACLAVVANGRETFKSSAMFIDGAEGVMPIRSERLRESNGKAVLVLRDFWVDPLTLAAKEIATTEVQLTKVAAGPIDSAVWAFRSKRGLELVMPTGGNAQLSSSDGSFFNSSCAHLQATLPMEAKDKPPPPPDAKVDKADKGDKPEKEKPEKDKAKGITIQGFFSKLTPLEEGNEKTGEPPPPQRLIRIGVAASTSQSSKDPEPIVSVVLRALDEIPDPPKKRNKAP